LLAFRSLGKILSVGTGSQQTFWCEHRAILTRQQKKVKIGQILLRRFRSIFSNRFSFESYVTNYFNMWSLPDNSNRSRQSGNICGNETFCYYKFKPSGS